MIHTEDKKQMSQKLIAIQLPAELARALGDDDDQVRRNIEANLGAIAQGAVLLSFETVERIRSLIGNFTSAADIMPIMASM